MIKELRRTSSSTDSRERCVIFPAKMNSSAVDVTNEKQYKNLRGINDEHKKVYVNDHDHAEDWLYRIWGRYRPHSCYRRGDRRKKQDRDRRTI